MGNISGKYAIVGIGETETGKLPNYSTYGLHLLAIQRALKDAGLSPKQVDGLLTNQPLADAFRSYAIYLAGGAGIVPNYTTDLAIGGATPAAMAQHAAMAIDAGLCETVVCIHARKARTMGQNEIKRDGVREGDETYESAYGFVGAVGMHACMAQRHMHEYGTTSEQLGAIAVACRKHATLNQGAYMRKPLTIEEHQDSRFIVKPLRMLDCCLVSDGGGAFVVTKAERAKDFPKPPVYILGMGQHHPHSNPLEAKTITTIGGKFSSQRAYRMAGLTPKEMDFAEIYDCFTITLLVTLEDYGFCPKGEGGSWVQNGRIEIGGELPVNTHGGLLSQAHIEGMLHITEAVKQLRGGEVEPERQVPDAKFGIVSGHGGRLCTHSTLILGNEVPA